MTSTLICDGYSSMSSSCMAVQVLSGCGHCNPAQIQTPGTICRWPNVDDTINIEQLCTSFAALGDQEKYSHCFDIQPVED
jgi:hypothetical protein